MDIDALDHFHLEAVLVHFILKGLEPIEGPHFPDRDIGKTCRHTRDTRNLANMLKTDAIIPKGEPSKNHFHS